MTQIVTPQWEGVRAEHHQPWAGDGHQGAALSSPADWSLNIWGKVTDTFGSLKGALNPFP